MLGKNVETHKDVYGDHGRLETRICSVISDFQLINNPDKKWKELKQFIKIESIREFKNNDKETERQLNTTFQA